MIAKRVAMKSVKKSSFIALIGYLLGQLGKAERVGRVNVTNCNSSDPHWAGIEAEATQAQNTRAESDKTYHLLVSFRAGENPSPEVLETIEERICKSIGYGEHQRVSVVHTDTDNLHLHICINKIHPGRHTIHEPYFDHKSLGKLCAQLEAEYDLEKDNHIPKKTAGETRAADMENAAGLESLIGWIRRQCLHEILTAKSWAELHKAMRENGLEIREKGNGLVIVDREGVGVKASSVSRNCSKAAFEARLGKFEASPEARAKERPKRRYAPKPLASRVDTTELYAEYKAERESDVQGRGLEFQAAKATKNRRIEDAKRSARLKRAAIKLTSGRVSKKLLYGLASKKLKAEITKINREYLAERKAIYLKYRRRTWNDWLQIKARQGNKTALETLRAREARAGLKGDTIGSRGLPKEVGAIPGLNIDSVTKKGTVIYRVADTTIRDDGKVLRVGQGASPEGLEAALRIASERFGGNITVNGSPEFKELVVNAAAVARLKIEFDDPDLEKRRIFLLAGTSFDSLAARKYIDERNRKREKIADITEHRLYTLMDAGDVSFRGLRVVDGEGLALFEKGKQILVLPVDQATEARLKRSHLGDPASVTAEGTIQIRGGRSKR
ncbi:MAG: TraI/MobA(P) family conjugative relaxase [Syntrophobacteraceae bacterium]